MKYVILKGEEIIPFSDFSDAMNAYRQFAQKNQIVKFFHSHDYYGEKRLFDVVCFGGNLSGVSIGHRVSRHLWTRKNKSDIFIEEIAVTFISPSPKIALAFCDKLNKAMGE